MSPSPDNLTALARSSTDCQPIQLWAHMGRPQQAARCLGVKLPPRCSYDSPDTRSHGTLPRRSGSFRGPRMTYMQTTPLRGYIGNGEPEAMARWHDERCRDAQGDSNPIALELHQWRAERLRGWAQRGPWWAVEPDDRGCHL